MKKSVISFFTFVFILGICISSYAQDSDLYNELLSEIESKMKNNAQNNEYFSISIPDGYEIKKNNDIDEKAITNFWISVPDSSNIAITVSENKKKIAVNNFTEDDLIEYENEVKSAYKKNLKVDKISSNKEISSLGKYKYKCMSVTTYLQDYNLYQKQYITSSDNYLYVINIVSHTDYISSKELKNVLDSFEIHDSITAETKVMNNYAFKDKLLPSILAILVIMFIGFVVKKLSGKIKYKNCN